MDTSAIIVSAGSSSRMGGVNKQLAQINGITVIGRSMTAMEQSPSIGEIVVVTRSEDVDLIREIARKCGISKLKDVVVGGHTRQESVICGLKACSRELAYVAVHDGARPLVKSGQVERVIADARVFGAATLGVPVKDTIKVVSDGLIVDTPHRPSLYITQTPQVFRKTVYIEGVDFALEHGLDFTDDCQLAEAVNIKVHMTLSDYSNIKITTPEDLAAARAIVSLQEE